MFLNRLFFHTARRERNFFLRFAHDTSSPYLTNTRSFSSASLQQTTNQTMTEPSHSLPLPFSTMVDTTITELEHFYTSNPQIKSSHGLPHALSVYHHAVHALSSLSPPLSPRVQMEILVASLLHDTDDKKYFPNHEDESQKDLYFCNAKGIMKKSGVEEGGEEGAMQRVLEMIGWVSCSTHGNSVPEKVERTGDYHLLIPRWSDRLEAVGAVGVVRCWQFTVEKGGQLSSEEAPRAKNEEEVWEMATEERFAGYMSRGGGSECMISHYYDKLLHVARPPPGIVRNEYLEEKGREASKELVEVCVRYGRTGVVDEDYLREVAVRCGR